jgi:hypothetical protein
MFRIRAHGAGLLVVLLRIPAAGQSQLPSTSTLCQTNSTDLTGALQCAEQDLTTGHLEEAIEGFENVLKLDKADTTPGLRAEATSGLTRARNRLREKRETVWGRILSFLERILVPLLALGLWFLYRIVLNLFPRKGIKVSFSDLNAESGAANANSRSLTAELLSLLEDPEPLAVRGLQMNTMPGTSQPAFGVIRPFQAMTQASDFSSSKYPMKLGAVEFGLDDISRLISSVFGWPTEGTLVGWLSCGDGSAVAAAELSRRGPRSGYGRGRGPWRAAATGKTAREDALASIAAQILVDMRENKFTDSWQSLKACQDGIKIMREDAAITKQDGANPNLRDARRCFESALHHDSGNWIARFYLAMSLCGEDAGKPAIALRHFKILDEVLCQAADEKAFEDLKKVRLAAMRRQRILRFLLKRSAQVKSYIRNKRERKSPRVVSRLTGLLQHLVNYPECPFILQYNIAIALEELREKGGAQELCPSLGEGFVWNDPLESLAKIASLRHQPLGKGVVWNDPLESLTKSASLHQHARCDGHYSRYSELLDYREKFELSLYAQSARAYLKSKRGGPACVKDLRGILAEIEDTCDDARKEARCLNLRIDSWRAIETSRAVALASLARGLMSNGEIAGHQEARDRLYQEARDRLYQAIAAEPRLVYAYLQLADIYMKGGKELATNWDERASALVARALELNPTCPEATALLSRLCALGAGTTLAAPST